MSLKEIVNVIMILYPLVMKVVQNVEKVYGGATEGAIKKERALDAISNLIDGIDYFRGGTSEYKALVLDIASDLVDWVVSGLNATGLWNDEIVYEWDNEGDSLT